MRRRAHSFLLILTLVLLSPLHRLTPLPFNDAGHLGQLWISFAQLYEDNDRLEDARKIFERAVNVPFRKVCIAVYELLAGRSTVRRPPSFLPIIPVTPPPPPRADG